MKSTSIRTPLAGARGLGAAKSGTEHWWEQRLTSIALVPLTFAAVVIVISTIGRDYVAVAHCSARRSWRSSCSYLSSRRRTI